MLTHSVMLSELFYLFPSYYIILNMFIYIWEYVYIYDIKIYLSLSKHYNKNLKKMQTR